MTLSASSFSCFKRKRSSTCQPWHGSYGIISISVCQTRHLDVRSKTWLQCQIRKTSFVMSLHRKGVANCEQRRASLNRYKAEMLRCVVHCAFIDQATMRGQHALSFLSLLLHSHAQADESFWQTAYNLKNTTLPIKTFGNLPNFIWRYHKTIDSADKIQQKDLQLAMMGEWIENSLSRCWYKAMSESQVALLTMITFCLHVIRSSHTLWYILFPSPSGQGWHIRHICQTRLCLASCTMLPSRRRRSVMARTRTPL